MSFFIFLEFALLSIEQLAAILRFPGEPKRNAVIECGGAQRAHTTRAPPVRYRTPRASGATEVTEFATHVTGDTRPTTPVAEISFSY